jgi:vacuolar-type H+-ATPase subunit I/STV1
MFMIVSILMGLPRAVLALLWYFTDPRWTNVIHERSVKIVGFLLLPYTTLAYVLIHHWAGKVDLDKKEHLAIVAVAVLVDVGAWFSGKKLFRRKKD